MNHGSPKSETRHVGDLGNLFTNFEMYTRVEFVDMVIDLEVGSNNNILNRAIVVHAGQDDLGLGGNMGSENTGNAGARLACGLILEARPCKKASAEIFWSIAFLFFM